MRQKRNSNLGDVFIVIIVNRIVRVRFGKCAERARVARGNGGQSSRVSFCAGVRMVRIFWIRQTGRYRAIRVVSQVPGLGRTRLRVSNYRRIMKLTYSV